MLSAMKRLLGVVLTGMLVLMVAVPDVAADSTAKKIAKACKNKKEGTEVTVSGKKVKCPAAKK